MFIIPCPNCGPRAENEFTYGGPKTTLPKLDGSTDATEWQQAVHQCTNINGQHTELWYHTSGCETWFVVERNTKTHEISDALQASIAEQVK